MNADISIRKEDQGETINFEVESSDTESDLDIKPTLKRNKTQRLSRNPYASSQVIKQQARPQAWTSNPVSNMSSSNTPSNMKPMRSSKQTSKAFQDDMYEMFTNPDKRKQTAPSEESVDDDRETEEGSGEEEEGSEEESEEEEEQPAEGFATIDDEKQDYIYKFYRMQNKGIPVTKKFNMNSDIHEMRREYQKITRDLEVNASIKFSRRMLMACVTGMEFLNKRYDPFEVKLEGWSESVMENIDDYDNVFERLHDKYASKVSMAPEIELLLTLAGSAFMFHLTNTMFSSMPNINDIAKQNPDIIKNMMKSMSAMSKESSNHKSSVKIEEENDDSNEPSIPNNHPRDMKPPVFDLSGMMRSMQPPLGNDNHNNNDTRIQRSLFSAPNMQHPSETSMNSLQSAGVNSLRNTVSMVQTPKNNSNQGSSFVDIPINNGFTQSPSPSIISSSSNGSNQSKTKSFDTKSVDLSESFITSGGTKRKRKNTKLNLTAENTITI